MHQKTQIMRASSDGKPRERTATRFAVLAPALLALGGCSAINVYSEVMQPGQLSQSGTYAWGDGTLPGDAYPALRGEFIEQTIHDAVNAAMDSHGFLPVQTNEADVFVDFHMAANERQETITTYHGDASSEDGRDLTQTEDITYTEGVLVIDILAASDDALLWRGLASGVVGSQEPEWIRNRIQEVVTEMFAEFPERGGS